MREKIAYTVHPLPQDLKDELMSKGYKIIDAKFAGAKDKIFNEPAKDTKSADK